jgi:hypothetical protein
MIWSNKSVSIKTITCHSDFDHLFDFIVKAGADPTLEDRNQRIPLDEAVIANKPGIKQQAQKVIND